MFRFIRGKVFGGHKQTSVFILGIVQEAQKGFTEVHTSFPFSFRQHHCWFKVFMDKAGRRLGATGSHYRCRNLNANNKLRRSNIQVLPICRNGGDVDISPCMVWYADIVTWARTIGVLAFVITSLRVC